MRAGSRPPPGDEIPAARGVSASARAACSRDDLGLLPPVDLRRHKSRFTSSRKQHPLALAGGWRRPTAMWASCWPASPTSRCPCPSPRRRKLWFAHEAGCQPVHRIDESGRRLLAAAAAATDGCSSNCPRSAHGFSSSPTPRGMAQKGRSAAAIADREGIEGP